MTSLPAEPEEILRTAIRAFTEEDEAALELLDGLPAAVYATDRDGRITYYNSACVPFSGRTPRPGEDRWCVTWKLYTPVGDLLPHEECPMAIAVKQGRPVRGVEAIAERPDGTRVRFLPFPTPLIDRNGQHTGAVNLLLDITEPERPGYLRAQARRCRRLALAIGDSRTVRTLKGMADDYEKRAEALRPH